MAFDLKEPWGTHRTYQVFEEKHSHLFGRPEVTADRIVMCEVIAEEIRKALPNITNTLFAKYVLTQYMLLYIVRRVLEQDKRGLEALDNPALFVRQLGSRLRFKACIAAIISDTIHDLNYEVDQVGDDFDYRDKLRDAQWVQDITKGIMADRAKMITRGKIQSFEQHWDSLKVEAAKAI